MQKIKDLTNQTFNNLTAIRYVGKDKNNKSLWLFKCKCGNEVVKRGTNVTIGAIKSCGCLGTKSNFHYVSEKSRIETYKNHGNKIRHRTKLYKNNKSGATGVFYHKMRGKYLCTVCVNGKKKTTYKKDFNEAVEWRNKTLKGMENIQKEVKEDE